MTKNGKILLLKKLFSVGLHEGHLALNTRTSSTSKQYIFLYLFFIVGRFCPPPPPPPHPDPVEDINMDPDLDLHFRFSFNRFSLKTTFICSLYFRPFLNSCDFILECLGELFQNNVRLED
jgi:hypothetical protein